MKKNLNLLVGTDRGKAIKRPGAGLTLKPGDMPGVRRASFPSSLAPMLATLTNRPFSDPDWLFEPKLDGYCSVALIRHRKVSLHSHRGLDVTEQFPLIAEKAGALVILTSH
ncbi:MAG: hypothetical protein Q8O16_00860 [Dehalococcoidia bacterium]|nr:hypothetical protein [Dehalococcoidia bacterium]